MTTTTTKGRITGLLALPVATDVALQVGDPVHLVSAYKVALADGSKEILGTVSVRSVKRVSDVNSTTFPVQNTTGSQVTVEVRGLAVQTTAATGGAIAAGAKVAVNGSGQFVAANGTLKEYGLALTATTAAGQEIDILVTAV